MDILSKKERGKRMGMIKSKNTQIELKVRKWLWKNGYRGYRVHFALPGKPDIYFPKIKFAIFIDGCFWHGCKLCYKPPSSNNEYWENKINNNLERDERINKLLKKDKIEVFRIKEHQISKKLGSLIDVLNKYAGKTN